MENIDKKAEFLKCTYSNLLRQVAPDTLHRWGKMNVQQMIEHMIDYVRIANGTEESTLVTADEMLPRMHLFLESEKPFRENTPNVLMPDSPPAEKYANAKEAINKLQLEIDSFFEFYDADPSLTIINPFFGKLDYSHQVQLLYKHAVHHLKQFGVESGRS